MLANARVSPALPALDYQRAKAFYAETLGLPIQEETEGNAVFSCGHPLACIEGPVASPL
jgi:catechol 2,3-dioxygenase-like lactoylglutathione lyase family enzyme